MSTRPRSLDWSDFARAGVVTPFGDRAFRRGLRAIGRTLTAEQRAELRIRVIRELMRSKPVRWRE